MLTDEPPGSGMPDQDPEPPKALMPAMIAISFTVIAVQIQTAAADGGVHNLLPILIAALLTLAGTAGRRYELKSWRNLLLAGNAWPEADRRSSKNPDLLG